MALKSDMPEESRNSKVIKRDTFSIVFPDDKMAKKDDQDKSSPQKNDLETDD
ncbi:hypothetical protein MFLO_13490 [Listeria floridensis FSL S10-1187]|uniref:Uncharacterized protein n=1 Tax=Listeria floridensis FSL S10-1187 TaxID=1265817 RepID=A0ABP3AUZ5_9LIST|nr:hypothetical protein [Listeria floridensis]EUJ27184.1 hypothetical protein MFLO_13490 [Listeria floridensis FSL S10-1187]